MARPKKAVPSYRRHATGQAFVRIDGVDIYLGKHGSPASKNEYKRIIAETGANGGRLPVLANEITVAEVAARFIAHAKEYYRDADGNPGREVAHFAMAIKPLAELYGTDPACTFGPRAFKVVRNQLGNERRSRPYVNALTQRVRHVFRWAVAEELVPPTVLTGLAAVCGLKRGRTHLHEPEAVTPVADAIIDKTVEHATPTLAAMIRLMQHTGMRPGELCILRTCDLHTSGNVWVYTPHRHKTQHHGHERRIYIGPRAQEILRPWLRADTQAYVFTPAKSYAEYLEFRNEARKTPASCGNRPGTNRVKRPRRELGGRFTSQSFGRAVHAVCGRAFPPPDGLDPLELSAWRRDHRWNPNQLRHAFATHVRRDHGLEAAQVLLGHAACDITQVYAERDVAKAAAVALMIG